MFSLPLLAAAVLAGVFLGWRVPAAYAIGMGFLVVRNRRPPPRGGRVRAIAEFVGFAIVGAVIGNLLFGGAGGIIGFALGIAFRLADVPIEGGRPFRGRLGRRS
jgi:hypothetical protein